MIFGTEIFVGVIVFAALACFGGKYVTQQMLLRGRQQLPMSEILDGLPESIPRDEACEIFEVIEKSFRLPPGTLRLNDKISVLTAIDSWRLGHGQEEFEHWLKAKGIVSLQNKPSTIRELIVSVLPSDNSSGASCVG